MTFRSARGDTKPITYMYKVTVKPRKNHLLIIYRKLISWFATHSRKIFLMIDSSTCGLSEEKVRPGTGPLSTGAGPWNGISSKRNRTWNGISSHGSRTLERDLLQEEQDLERDLLPEEQDLERDLLPREQDPGTGSPPRGTGPWTGPPHTGYGCAHKS